MKQALTHGVTAGILAAFASLAYNTAYSQALVVDFSKVINPTGIIGSSIFGGVLASVGYHVFSKWVKNQADIWFNMIFLVLSFASLISPFAVSLPLSIESPELFAGLTIPMHLFPVLFWVAAKPLFYTKSLT